MNVSVVERGWVPAARSPVGTAVHDVSKNAGRPTVHDVSMNAGRMEVLAVE